MKESDPERINPSDWGGGYRSSVPSWQLPSDSAAKAGAIKREWEVSPNNPENWLASFGSGKSGGHSTDTTYSGWHWIHTVILLIIFVGLPIVIFHSSLYESIFTEEQRFKWATGCTPFSDSLYTRGSAHVGGNYVMVATSGEIVSDWKKPSETQLGSTVPGRTYTIWGICDSGWVTLSNGKVDNTFIQAANLYWQPDWSHPSGTGIREPSDTEVKVFRSERDASRKRLMDDIRRGLIK